MVQRSLLICGKHNATQAPQISSILETHRMSHVQTHQQRVAPTSDFSIKNVSTTDSTKVEDYGVPSSPVDDCVAIVDRRPERETNGSAHPELIFISIMSHLASSLLVKIEPLPFPMRSPKMQSPRTVVLYPSALSLLGIASALTGGDQDPLLPRLPITL